MGTYTVTVMNSLLETLTGFAYLAIINSFVLLILFRNRVRKDRWGGIFLFALICCVAVVGIGIGDLIRFLFSAGLLRPIDPILGDVVPVTAGGSDWFSSSLRIHCNYLVFNGTIWGGIVFCLWRIWRASKKMPDP